MSEEAASPRIEVAHRLLRARHWQHRQGLDPAGLDKLVWGITGKKSET